MSLDLSKLTQDLIDKHARKTERLSAVLRGTSRTAYRTGVEDTLRLLQESALDESVKEQLSAPLAVQPNHIAGE